MRTIEGFRLRKLGDEYILVGEAMSLINFNKMITFNETSAFMWEIAEQLSKVQGSFDANMLCKALCEEYDVSPERAMTDVENTLEAWVSAGVVEV